MDVGDWLRSLGLGQHEALFRENEIDAEVLPELTEADLEKIGVPLGHRKCLLKAIADLGEAEAPTKPTHPGLRHRRQMSPRAAFPARMRKTPNGLVKLNFT